MVVLEIMDKINTLNWFILLLAIIFFARLWLLFKKHMNARQEQKIKALNFDFLYTSIIFVVFFAILLRPSFGIEQTYKYESLAEFSYLFVLDNSLSMSVSDAPGGKTRLDYAKEIIEKILQEYPSYAGLIVFANKPDLVLPITSDVSSFSALIESVECEDIFYAQGTDFVDTLKFVDQYLIGLSKLPNPPVYYRKVKVILLSDGEVVNAEKGVYALKTKNVDKFLVVGVGSQAGGTIMIDSKSKLYTPNSHGPVVSKMDKSNLIALANANNGVLFTQDNIDNLFRDLKDEVAQAKKGDKTQTVRREIYPFLILLLQVIVIMFVLDIPKLLYFYISKISE